MANVYDCVVIGSGPAGGSAAYHLARRGFRVLVVEKQALPRYKPCGGGVSPSVAAWFDFDFTPAISAYVDSVRCTWDLGEVIDAPLSTSAPVWMVRRDVFDHFLVKQAVALGAELRTETTVTAITRSGSRWQIETDGGPIDSRFLIGADGAKGRTAKWLGLEGRAGMVGGAIEVEIPAPVPEPRTVHLEFGMIRDGYLWNFPKAGSHSIGIGTVGQRKVDLRTPLARYVEYFGLSLDGVKQHGHPLLLWGGPSKLHADGALLCGEAAAVVDPFTAEGIRPSLYTGMRAADAVAEALAGDTRALARYTAHIRTENGSEMKWAKRLSQVFFAFPRLSYSVAVRRPGAAGTMGALLAGTVSYKDVAKRAIRRLTGASVLAPASS